MNRQEALDWCVENLKDWPNDFMRLKESEWNFGRFRRDNAIILSTGSMNYITKQDWLEAKTAKEKEVEIDWSKAPEGATHYTPATRGYNFCWYKRLYNKWFYINPKSMKEWDSMDYEGDLLEVLRLIPFEKWTPKVGEECEAAWGMTKETWAEITYVGKYFFFEITKGRFIKLKVSELEDLRFRPLRTQEEIEREELFNECVGALQFIPQCEEINSHHKDAIEWLIDSGLIIKKGGAK